MEIDDPETRYHFSTWGNGPNMGRLVADSLELCQEGPDCRQRHVIVTEVARLRAARS